LEAAGAPFEGSPYPHVEEVEEGELHCGQKPYPTRICFPILHSTWLLFLRRFYTG
jgi:hypothetical protein